MMAPRPEESMNSQAARSTITLVLPASRAWPTSARSSGALTIVSRVSTRMTAAILNPVSVELVHGLVLSRRKASVPRGLDDDAEHQQVVADPHQVDPGALGRRGEPESSLVTPMMAATTSSPIAAIWGRTSVHCGRTLSCRVLGVTTKPRLRPNQTLPTAVTHARITGGTGPACLLAAPRRQPAADHQPEQLVDHEEREAAGTGSPARRSRPAGSRRSGSRSARRGRPAS